MRDGYMYNEYDPEYQAWMEDQDVYSGMSARDQEWNDRLSYASEVERMGNPDMAAEIRMGA